MIVTLNVLLKNGCSPWIFDMSISSLPDGLMIFGLWRHATWLRLRKEKEKNAVTIKEAKEAQEAVASALQVLKEWLRFQN